MTCLLTDYFADIPKLHTWDNGATWNTGGFERRHFEPLAALIAKELPSQSRFIETGAGNSTIFFLLQNPAHVASIAPDAEIFARVDAYCTAKGISLAPLEKYIEGSQWALPRLVGGRTPDFDLGLIDGCHGWPLAFVDLYYMNHLIRPGGFLMVDDVQLYSIRQMANLLREQPGYEVSLDLGKAVVFRKTTDSREIGDWFAQPYIVRRSRPVSRWRRRLNGLIRADA